MFVQFYSDNDPLYVSGNGYRQGLALVLDAQVDDYAVKDNKFCFLLLYLT